LQSSASPDCPAVTGKRAWVSYLDLP
jgi:hypothetical protein